jgi:hypothetical protein
LIAAVGGTLPRARGEFRARSLFILDEAHHAAPASGSRYAVDSQFTRAIEALAPSFELGLKGFVLRRSGYAP